MQTEGDTGLSNNAITYQCQQFRNLKFTTVALQEEQEREFSHEIEQKRPNERLPLAEPKSHGLHADVLEFVTTGNTVEQSNAGLVISSLVFSISMAPN